MSNKLTDYVIRYENQRYECLTITLYANILWKDRNVLCLYHGHSLIDEKIDYLINIQKAQLFSVKSYNLNFILGILKELIQLPELPGVIDIGQIQDSFDQEQAMISKETLIAKLWYIHLNSCNNPRDVVLYGFGRIGRLLARELCSDPAHKINLNLRAVVTRDPIGIEYLKKRASLLKKDSIHGSFRGSIDIDEQTNSLIINGSPIQFISAQHPAEINYEELGIHGAILIDNTGKFRDKKSLSKHLTCPGISKVILTAPAKDLPNIVYGINHDNINELDSNLYSTASCTTNAITPVLNLLDKKYGIIKGHIETIHAYTNDQNLVDNMHAKSRRGRSAALNMVITETGAGSAVSKILPKLKDKLTSNAIRVPIANGSLAILMLELKKRTSENEIHQLLMDEATTPGKHKQIDISFEQDLVSSDIIGDPAAAIVDGCATCVSSDGHTVNIYIWYDNEYGYCMQVLGFANYLSTQINGNIEPVALIQSANEPSELTTT